MERRSIDIRAVRANVERMLAESPEASVVVLADETAHTGLLVQVMDQVRLAGVNDIAVAARQQEAEDVQASRRVRVWPALTIAVLLFLIMHVRLHVPSVHAPIRMPTPSLILFVSHLKHSPLREMSVNHLRNPIRPKYRQPRALPYRREPASTFRHRR